MSPRKVRLVANLIKGMEAERAVVELQYRLKRAALPLCKLLQSAIANAKHNFQVEKGGLYVKKIVVGEGPTLKRYRARAFGRAATIRNRTSHVSLVLAVTEGLVSPSQTGRETKEGVRVKITKSKKKEEPVVRDLTTEDRHEEQERQQEKHPLQTEHAARVRTPGFVRRMFRRKAI